MDLRKNSLSSLKICRFCLSKDETLTSLYDRIRKPKNATSLSLKILSCLSIEVFPSDKMPTYICQQCIFFIDLLYNYKNLCRKADEKIMQFVQRGHPLDSMTWPMSLTKVYNLVFKKTPNFMKMQDGVTTVQLTSQEISDSEEEENNVFNIKLDDSSEEGVQSIQLVPSKGEEKDKVKPAKEIVSSHNSASADSEEEEIVKDSEDVWPCDECVCTYPLRQLLHLHKKQKHRARKVSCDQCDAKFFSKYDLNMHMHRHSDEMLFQCVACDKGFKRHVLLKRHERRMHRDIPQLACQNCSATFLSSEEFTAHQKLHKRQRTIECNFCDKKFINHNTRVRHMRKVHPHRPPFRCEYCPAQFATIANLVRHVRSHAGDRPYPCRHCDKRFTKSHHYTRHLRDQHGVGDKPAREERFRCEQCEESFDSQDELIYHSAIHATQNLTCPLCQEKFANVDAVTAHIKSHVNGTEFMCDLCELVFTSKEKLDAHLTIAHAEELDHTESSVEMDTENDEDDSAINVKEEDDHMVVEIKKTDSFMLAESQTDQDGKLDGTANSEESESEMTYTELATVDTLAIAAKTAPVVKAEEKAATAPVILGSATITKVTPKPAEPAPTSTTADTATASILRKAEEVKRKVQLIASEPVEKKVQKVESSSAGASDKSLRLLEKELQELKRTNTRNDALKTPIRSMETLRNRRPQLHTSTPKTRATEEKKLLAAMKSPAAEKKVPDRLERKAVTKENKEPKEMKETKEMKDTKEVKDTKETKEIKETKETKETKEIKEIKSTPVKEDKKKEEEVKEKETPKNVVKNGTSEKTPEEGVRRSTRPSKIKDYAKMIRDKSQESNDDSDDEDDEEYIEFEKPESRAKTRRSSVKAPPKPAPATPSTPATPARKRGRPRKDQSAQKEVPAKMKREEPEEEEEEAKEKEDVKMEAEVSKPAEPSQPAAAVEKEVQSNSAKPDAASKPSTSNDADPSTNSEPKPTTSGVLMSPTGHTLKKVPIKALPPGIKPLPLPSRTLGAGELCEMQIGKKMVKVQKIVMTKADVEAMAKKGLLEMKDGTMVLKQGIKLPTTDALSLKALVGEKDAGKESPSKTDNTH